MSLFNLKVKVNFYQSSYLAQILNPALVNHECGNPNNGIIPNIISRRIKEQIQLGPVVSATVQFICQ
jgi:hypothetical protein